jgi:hypothetical protein
MPKTHINCSFGFTNDIPANEPAGDRRSPLQADNGVLGGACTVRSSTARPGQMPKTHINYPPVFTMIFRRMNQRATAGRPYRLTTGVLGGTCRGGLRPPARGKCPKRVLITRSGLLTIFPRKDQRATAGRPYRLTTVFRVVLVGAVFDRARGKCPKRVLITRLYLL